MRKGLKASLIVLLVFLVLWGTSELAIPMFAVRYVREKIQKKYPGIESVQVSLKAFPALKLAFRKYDLLKIELDNIRLEGFSFSRLSLESRTWPEGDFEAVLLEEEINRFFTIQSSRVENARVRLERDTAVVAGKVRTSVAVVAAEARGHLVAKRGRLVFFVPEEIMTGTVRLGDGFLDSVRQALKEAPIYVIREDLPYRISSINITENKLLIEGKVELDRALGLSRP